METVGAILDPLGLVPTDRTRREARMLKAERKYRALWNEGNAKGYPMELLGFPRNVELLAGGLGGGPPGFPNIPTLGIFPTRGRPITDSDVKEEEKKVEMIEESLREIDEHKHEYGRDVETFQDLGEGGLEGSGGAGRRDPITTRRPRQVINPYPGSSDEGKAFKRNNPTASIGAIRGIVVGLMAQKRIRPGGLDDPKKIQKAFARNPRLVSAVLNVLDDSDIIVGDTASPTRINEIVDTIMRRTGIETALLMNDLIDAMKTNSNNPDVQDLIPVATSNLTVPRVDAELRPIGDDEDTVFNIRDLLQSRGVDRVIASRVATTIVEKMKNITKELQAKFGGVDVGIDQAHQILSNSLASIINALDADAGTSRLSIHNLGKTILAIIYDSKDALKQFMAGLTDAQKAKVFSDVYRDFYIPVSDPGLPPFRTPRGAVGEVFDQKLDEWLYPPATVNWEIDSSRPRRLPPSSRAINRPIDEQVVRLPTPNRASIIRPDPSGLPSVNVILRDPSAIARLIRGWSEGNDIYRSRNYRWRIEPPNPDDPPEPGGGGDNIVVETPWGRRRFQQKEFVLALIIAGFTASSIVATIDALRKTLDDPDKTKQITIIPKTKDDPPSITITDSIPPKPDDFPMEGLPQQKIDPNPRTGGASYIEKTIPIMKAGLSDEVDEYNSIVDEFNKAIQTRDLLLINRLRSKLDRAFQPIRDAIVRADRPDKPFDIPDPYSSIGLGRASAELDAGGDYLKGPSVEGTQLSPLEITPEMEKSGLVDIIALANKYIADYNKASTDKDHSKMAEIMAKLNNLAQWVRQPRFEPKQPSKESVDGSDAAEAELRSALEDYSKAKQGGASVDDLKRQNLYIQELRAKYMKLKQQTPAPTQTKTYLRPDQFRKEVFPKTPDQTRKFNELQRLEQFLTTHVNPNDEDNKALQEYQDYVANLDGGLLNAASDPTNYYQARIDTIKQKLGEYRIDPESMNRFLGDEAYIIQDESGDDPNTRVVLPGNGTIETDDDVSKENMSRPDQLIGGEANILVQTRQEVEEEDKLWREYSLVRPGHGRWN